jgi:hypothetical protein
MSHRSLWKVCAPNRPINPISTSEEEEEEEEELEPVGGAGPGAEPGAGVGAEASWVVWLFSVRRIHTPLQHT